MGYVELNQREDMGDGVSREHVCHAFVSYFAHHAIILSGISVLWVVTGLEYSVDREILNILNFQP